jgi:hypothetical protein
VKFQSIPSISSGETTLYARTFSKWDCDTNESTKDISKSQQAFFPLIRENSTWQIWEILAIKFTNLGKKVIVKFGNFGKYASIQGVTIVKINLKLFCFFCHIQNTMTGKKVYNFKCKTDIN